MQPANIVPPGAINPSGYVADAPEPFMPALQDSDVRR